MMKKYVTVYKLILIVLVLIIVIGCVSYNIGISAPSKEDHPVMFEVTENSTYLTLASSLKEKGLIRSITFYKIYVKIFRPENLQKGTYELNQNMSVKQLLNTLENGSYHNATLTFPEGLNMRAIANIISKNTSNSAEDVYNLLKDKTYLETLISQYWFLNSDIQNEKLYYALEGYLYPDTYQLDKDASVKDIFKAMLDQTAKKLEPYKIKLENSSHSIHEIMTMASMIELEAMYDSDRANVASVFYNRLSHNMNLGSDVTTYYGAKVDMGSRDLTNTELNDNNPYNTRNAYLKTLPVGPICNPSTPSIEAAVNPSDTDYLYFVADKNGEVHFTKTLADHDAKIRELKSKGLWFSW